MSFLSPYEQTMWYIVSVYNDSLSVNQPAANPSFSTLSWLVRIVETLLAMKYMTLGSVVSHDDSARLYGGIGIHCVCQWIIYTFPQGSA